MDANQLRFWMVADPLRQWEPIPEDQPPDVYLDAGRRSVRLASSLGTISWEEKESQTQAEQRLFRTPGTLDAFGTWAYLDQSKATVMAAGAGPQPTALLTFDPTNTLSLPTDLVLGHDDVLYVASGGGKVLLKDPRHRWDPATVSAEGFHAWRLAPAPGGGVFAIPPPTQLPGSPSPNPNAPRVQLARVSGLPLPREVLRERAPRVFRPQGEDTDPPRMSLVLDEPPLAGEFLVGIAVSPEGRVALLSWVYDAAKAGAASNAARLRFFTGTALTAPITLNGAQRPFSFAWLSADRIAVLLRVDSGAVIAVAYLLGKEGQAAAALGDYYPLTAHDGGPFLHSPATPPHYRAQDGSPVPLHPISLPSFVTVGSVRNKGLPNEPLLDGGSPRAVWHRLYLEASLPPGCGIRVFLAATNTPERPEDDENDGSPRLWHEHVFGDVAPERAVNHVPRGVWLSAPSELPFHTGLLPCTPEPERRGLFTVLIQRAGLRVRTLRGRYLWVKVQLVGDGRSTPELFALRAHAPRFSYAEHYLPELYREQLFGEEANDEGASTPADFLERFLGLAEGILTPLEDRIASASLLTEPRTVPEESLEWLASWIGFSFDPALPRERRRQMLQAAPAIRPWRGTLRGLSLALDALTGGAVARGGLVIVEEFRLRRTFSTLLGIDLTDEDDPLLPGLYRSGNSIVGDTLFLGDEQHKEFLALFGEDIPKTRGEQAAVEEFFLRLAHRVTVLVHQDFDARELGLIQRVAELEGPAHVSLSVKLASKPLMVGVASLVGIDTYLGPLPKPEPLRVGGGVLGSKNLIERPPSLDPRLHAGG